VVSAKRNPSPIGLSKARRRLNEPSSLWLRAELVGLLLLVLLLVDAAPDGFLAERIAMRAVSTEETSMPRSSCVRASV